MAIGMTLLVLNLSVSSYHRDELSAQLLSIFEGTSSWSTSQLRQWLRPYFFVALFVPIVVVWSTTLIFNGFGQLMSTIVWWTQH